MSEKKKVVLSYSGGLDTSVILHWLIKTYDYEVIAYCANIGQGKKELDNLEEKAIKTGATKTYISDLCEDFVKDYVFPCIQSTAIYEMRYLLGTSIARPFIAKEQIRIAKKEGAVAVAHGATGKGNDQVRFELTFIALAPELKIISPWREWDMKGRLDLVNYAQKENIPITITTEKPYSIDSNVVHNSYEGGVLEDPYQEPLDNMFLWTNSPEKAPNEPEYIEIDFEKGNAVSINSEAYTPYQLLKKLNEYGATHGIGRIDIVENRLVGIKSRGIYETPGVTILHLAHRDLESITIDKKLQALKDKLSIRYAELVYNGEWFSPERESLQAFMLSTQQTVSGVVRLKLYKGNAIIVGRKAPITSLYKVSLASFEDTEQNFLTSYNQKDAEGFIHLFGLPIKSSYSIYNKYKLY